MTVPTISNLPTVPATSDPNFETEAPALFNHIKNTFVSEMNSAISFINSSTFDATVEFKNANFTAARNFLYMIDTSSAGVSVTLPLNPSTGDQLLLMDQKRSFGTNNLTIGRNGQNINGAASNVVSKSTGALIRCIFQSSYGWTVDLYEGEWESGTSAGDLVYNGGNVGIGTSSPQRELTVGDGTTSPNILLYAATSGNSRIEFGDSGDQDAGEIQYDHSTNHMNFSTNGIADRMVLDDNGRLGIGTSAPSAKLHATGDIVAQNATNPTVSANDNGTLGASDKSVYIRYDTTNDVGVVGSFHNGTGAKNLVLNQLGGNVGIGTSAPKSELHVKAKSNRIPVSLAADEMDDNSVCRIGLDTGDSSIYFAYGNAGDAIMQIANSAGTTAQDLFINPFGGKVGIGTSSPSGKLEIAGDKDATNLIVGAPLHTVNGGGLADYSELLFDNNYTTGTSGTAYIRHYANSHQNSEGALFFGTTSSTGTTSQALVIRGDGNVGIGVGSPPTGYRLDVTGGRAVVRGSTEGVLVLDDSGVADASRPMQYISSDGGTLKLGNANRTSANGTTNSVDRMVIDSDGNVEVKTGNLVIGTAGKGIDFSATSGTGTSEILTDYEQGTFTPTVSGTWTTNPTTLSGKYTKIGRMVYIQVEMTGGVKSSATSGYLTGLPIAVASSGTGSVTNVDVQDFGNCLFANTDRIWFTATNLGTAKILITGQYIAS